MDRLPPAVHVTTAALLLNLALGLFGGPPWLIGGLILVGPGLVLWMVWSVLNDRRVQVRDLDPQEAWGYQDRPDLRPMDEQ